MAAVSHDQREGGRRRLNRKLMMVEPLVIRRSRPISVRKPTINWENHKSIFALQEDITSLMSSDGVGVPVFTYQQQGSWVKPMSRPSPSVSPSGTPKFAAAPVNSDFFLCCSVV